MGVTYLNYGGSPRAMSRAPRGEEGAGCRVKAPHEFAPRVHQIDVGCCGPRRSLRAGQCYDGRNSPVFLAEAAICCGLP